MSKSTGTSGTNDGSKSGSDFSENRKCDTGCVIKDDGLSEIEKLMKGKTFSRWLVIVIVVDYALYPSFINSKLACFCQILSRTSIITAISQPL